MSASSLLNRFTLRAKFRHMQILVMLAEVGNMRRAAEALNMTQPGVSQQIADLEKLVEAPLFLRHTRGVSPTPAAVELLPAARQILATLGEASERVTARLERNEETIRISTSPAGIGAILSGRLGVLERAHPLVQFRITQMGDETSLSLAIESAPDLILTRAPTVMPENWTFRACVDDRMTAVCHPSHPLAHRNELTPCDLADARWQAHRSGSLARTVLEDLAHRYEWHGFNMGSTILHTADLTRDLLSEGRLLAFLPRSVLLQDIEAGRLIELDAGISQPLNPVGLLFRADAQAAVTQRIAASLFEATASLREKQS
jgi:DNA-binding transcriptional LysR family regulator